MGFIPMKIALAQTNSTVGDLCGNAKRILSFARRAADGGANVVVFPELSLTGYPPRDLLEKESFLDRTEQHLERLAADAEPLNISIICGTVTRTGAPAGLPIYNSAAVLQGGASPSASIKCCCPPTTSSTRRAISNRRSSNRRWR
jgi:NAD+ synthase (glutamine-hydrolysing)